MLSWSPIRLKFTLGIGALFSVALISEFWRQAIPVWVAVAIAVLPLAVFVFADPDDIPRSIARFLQVAASLWYLTVNSVLTVVLLAQGNLNKGSLLFLVGIAVGAIPCLIVLGQAAMADLAAQSDSSANNEQEDDVRRPCDRATETIDVSQTIVYRPRKGKLLLLLAVSATFVPAGLSMAHSGEAAGWFVAAFFGLAGVVFSLQFVPNCSYLRVSAKGIELRAFWRTHGYEWSDISHFYAGSIASKQFVMFQFSSSYRRAGTARTVTKTLTGAEGVLPDTYGFEAEELAEHLNQWKARLDHDNNKRDA